MLALIHTRIDDRKDYISEVSGRCIIDNLKGRAFTVNDLFPLLEDYFKELKGYRLQRLSQESLRIEKLVEEEITETLNHYHLLSNYLPSHHKYHLSIKSEYLNTELYRLLSEYSARAYG